MADEIPRDDRNAETNNMGGRSMTTEQAIIQRIKTLPESARREVLDFMDFLAIRIEAQSARDEEISWSDGGLASALRDMEDEPDIYTRADLTESFR